MSKTHTHTNTERDKLTGRAAADVLWRACRLEAKTSILAVVVLTNAGWWILNSYRGYLAVFTFVTLLTDADITVDSILAGGTILTKHAMTVVYIYRAVFAREAHRTVTPGTSKTKPFSMK